MQHNNYDLLLEKLDKFTRKYYINQAIRGLLYFTGLIVLVYTVFAIAEYNFYFSSGVRKTLLYGFGAMTLASFSLWVLVPVLHYFRLGKQISQEKAATIIGEHFTNVKDKLLNVLQLKEQAGQNVQQAELIRASIEQKSLEISPVQFGNAIDLRKNKKYIRYALPPVLLLLLILLVAPAWITDGTNRIVRANEHFERQAPFSFVILNKSLESTQFEDFELLMTIEGKSIPQEVYINISGFRYLLTPTRDGDYSYTFKNLKEPVTFKFNAAGFDSRPYTIELKERAIVNEFKAQLQYPAYTGIKSETLTNVGDLIVPKGTVVSWNIETSNTDNIGFSFGDAVENAERKGQNYFSLSKKVLQATDYNIVTGNNRVNIRDTVSYKIQVIEDKYPSIEMKEFIDSTRLSDRYFAGSVADDYGLTALKFHYSIKNEDGTEKKKEAKKVELKKGKESDFTFYVNFSELGLDAGDVIEYYFEVSDNDAVNGIKSTRSSLLTNKKASIKELKEERKERKEEIEKSLASSNKESKDIQDKIQALKESLLQKKDMDWQSRKELENIMKMQQEMLDKMKETREEFKKNQENRQETGDEDEQLKNKEEKLDELFNEIENNKANELMEKIQELMQKMDREQTISTLDEMKKNNEVMQKNMQRLEELYKNLEVEYEMQEMAKDLNELGEKQEKLAEDSDKMSKEELLNEQNKLNEEAKDLQKKMEDLKDKNSDLERPKDMNQSEDDMNDASDEMDQARDNLEQNNKNEAKKNQKKAAKKLKEASEKMKNSMQSGGMQAMQEDLESLRQLLDNLLNISFSEEALIRDLAVTPINTPKYLALIQEQFKIRNNFGLVEDSLFALSKRVAQLESIVLEKSADIRYHLEKSVKHLEEREVSASNIHQQRAMTYTNDLALIFNEAMENMQMDMSNSMPGNQMCNNPKPGQQSGEKMPMNKISEGQEKLNEDMKKLSEQNKEKGKEGEQSISAQELGELMQRQAMLRRALEKLSQEKREQGKGSKILQEIIDQMDKTEYELANKRLNHETLKRQEQIKIKLLEAEKADREQEFEEKRRAETAMEQKRTAIPKELEEYLKNRANSINEYKTVSPGLNKYYKELVDKYMNAVKSESLN